MFDNINITEFGFYIALAYGGAVCNILWKLSEAEKSITQFSLYKDWWTKNRFGTIFHFIAVILCLYLFKEMDQLNATVSIMTGWGADILIRGFADRFIKKNTEEPKDNKTA